ncbi:MAG: Gfo/Idh/MocA family oxidoreductase [Lentisphaerae bacterium]|nr:Gfo/Idh/MocA family oxidoreductase [Lentisphaerota bacterium]MBT4823054.1 Gfo/Idh/MocA family oxidoreductase [Lentisphaerota bacterium]MBT5610583.1 Gfo/Idh/MocA family oxidoreductase [Lentisphaerota bacterium]MBT7060177.1 Gfo/Idh/MocA family oxidoreductase [Lentisphaerota bacterium]MBT7844142.1 Gfo/Idh/MocA family oxidoreductase [Lentisphaerota bacterium]
MSQKGSVNLGLIGQAFMGRAHSNAWNQVNRHCNPPVKANLHTVCARNEETLGAFAELWGWQNTSTDWQATMANPEIELVDIGVPNDKHLIMAKAAIAAGKMVCCEKPLAGKFDEAREMVRLAKEANATTFVWYNYRRCPAIAYARMLVDQGVLGDVRHVRAFYLQDWADESVPLIWRFDGEIAGSGSHGDLCAHAIDMVRFVAGEEVTEVSGALFETFIKERAIMTAASDGGIAGGSKGDDAQMGKVTVDDAVLFLARFEGGGVGHFEATRMATGNQNKLGFEINGTKGSLAFDFEQLNELRYYDATCSRGTQGWRTIITTHAPDHPYIEHWWPDSHMIGYEHAFTNMAYDILRVCAGQEPVVPLPDFEDAFKTQCVLEAATVCANEQRAVKMSELL